MLSNMWDTIFEALMLLLLLQQMVQGQTAGSESADLYRDIKLTEFDAVSLQVGMRHSPFVQF